MASALSIGTHHWLVLSVAEPGAVVPIMKTDAPVVFSVARGRLEVASDLNAVVMAAAPVVTIPAGGGKGGLHEQIQSSGRLTLLGRP
jgi:hypothetical protein